MLRYRQSQEFYRTLLLAMDDKSDKKNEIFAKYREAMFPDVTRHAAKVQFTGQQILERAVLRGPIAIRRSEDV